MRFVDLYAPQGVDLGEGGSFSYWCDTVSDWPELHAISSALESKPLLLECHTNAIKFKFKVCVFTSVITFF